MDNKTTIRTFDSQTKYQGGGKLPYDDWYKTVPKEYNDTTHYNLRRAYDLLPFNQLENWRTNPNENHLSTVGYDSNSNSYEFLKRKDHPTIQYELDWYKSKEGADFRNQYDLDTSGEYYKYIPKKEQGGLLDKVFKKAPDDGKWARDPKKDSELENALEYVPVLGNVLSVNDALDSYQNAIKNPSWNNIKDAGLETLGLIPFGSVTKNLATGLSKKFVRKAKAMGYFIDTGVNALSDENTDKKQQGGYIRTSKSGRQFVYPSIQEKKQEIINKLMKTTNKPDD